MNKHYTIKEIKEYLTTLEDIHQPLLNQFKADPRQSVKNAVAAFEKKRVKDHHLRLELQEKLKLENELRDLGYKAIAGIDEVGRGPLAGPVVTAAVILPENCDTFLGINDSKTISEKKREYFAEIIKENALAYKITVTDVELIDRMNIYEATKLSMLESIHRLSVKPDFLLIDAMKLGIDIPQKSIIKGDQLSLSIASASIIAKVYRDNLMKEYAHHFPEYGFEKHKGYGTKSHLQAIQTFGYTPIHRQSFAPIQQSQKNDRYY